MDSSSSGNQADNILCSQYILMFSLLMSDKRSKHENLLLFRENQIL